jgi:tetratricopeptide (TPR) repeat protein
MDRFEKQVERNLKGIQFEKEGQLEQAIKLYEANIKENFEGNHPYDRLAVIYRKQGRVDDEIRVLEKAVWVFENVVYKERADRIPKLKRFQKQLDKAKQRKKKYSK